MEEALLDILRGCRATHTRAVRMAKPFQSWLREAFMKEARQDRMHARYTIQRIRECRAHKRATQ